MVLPNYHSHASDEAYGSSTAAHRGNLTHRVGQRTGDQTIEVPEAPGQDPLPNQPLHGRQREPSAKLKRVSGYSKSVMTNISSTVVAYYSARKDITQHAENLSIIACSGLVFTTFLTDLILMLLTSCLLTCQSIGKRQYVAATILIYVSNVLFMLTSVGLLVLLDKRYAFLAVFLLPIIGILRILFQKELQTAQVQRSTDYENYETEMGRVFDFSASVTFLTFTGMIGTIFFYFKNFAEKTGNLGVTVSESSMFFTITFGLLAMLLTTVPPSFSQRRTREQLISVIRALGYLLFGLQTLTGLEIAAGFVKGFVVLAFFPDFVGAVYWFRKEFFHEETGGEAERERELSSGQVNQERGNNGKPETFAIPVTTFIFTVLMTVYSIYRGDQEYSFHLQRCMLFIFSAYMSSLSWMMLTLKPPETERFVMVANILTRFTVGLLVVAVLDVTFFAIPALKKII